MRITILAIIAALALAGCGRKGSLEVPGPAAAPMQARANMGNTVVLAPDQAEAPRRRGRSGADTASVDRRTTDIFDRNADAPETGDAIAEGPTAGSRVPRRRFLLDPLL